MKSKKQSIDGELSKADEFDLEMSEAIKSDLLDLAQDLEKESMELVVRTIRYIIFLEENRA